MEAAIFMPIVYCLTVYWLLSYVYCLLSIDYRLLTIDNRQ